MMTPTEVSQVLAKAAAFDQRTVGEADIFAWMEAVGDVDLDDALAAVTRHYRESTDFLRPAHLREQVRAIRNERAAQRHSEALELPSRFEADDIRDARLRAGVAQLAQVLAVPARDADDPRERAIARARRERRDSGRELPPPRAKRQGKAIDLSKVAGPAWSDAAVRELESVTALHSAGRACGKSTCSRPQCNPGQASA